MSKVWENTKKFMGFVEEEKGDKEIEMVMNRKPLVKMQVDHNKKNTNKNNDMQIRIVEPKDQDQSLEIANSLREGVPVIISLKYMEGDESKRLFDFICGTTYAIDGHYRKLGSNILLFTPNNIDIIEDEESSVLEDVDINEIRKSMGLETK